MAEQVGSSVLWQSEHLFNDDKEKKQHSEKTKKPDPLACWCSVPKGYKKLSWVTDMVAVRMGKLTTIPASLMFAFICVHAARGEESKKELVKPPLQS